ncbi:hypothetical protein K493DRAFT_334011 [Basidiobolus meristosporus CBS 931.73]|uniref:Uncharacterized protein n=1 Tax=Basidiobolus meristosporus CBS 931.73 TaxID=1314790 RepID=A0A1Y1Z1T4_9FUNG|nr:hypothetical protein K493DRAFT_334011 [Basidiobolus meristosporus CBS 931.73]|eukprot:ORY04169.1 hypothetical protein K493DRAFT_334011 [Basidiobolus meristosporus CBS 931.73]
MLANSNRTYAGKNRLMALYLFSQLVWSSASNGEDLSPVVDSDTRESLANQRKPMISHATSNALDRHPQHSRSSGPAKSLDIHTLVNEHPAERKSPGASGEQIVLFPDNKLRLLGGAQNLNDKEFGLNELARAGYGPKKDAKKRSGTYAPIQKNVKQSPKSQSHKEERLNDRIDKGVLELEPKVPGLSPRQHSRANHSGIPGELPQVIQEEAADTKKTLDRMGTLRSLLGELSAIEKNTRIMNQETRQYVKNTATRVQQAFGAIEKALSQQSELRRRRQGDPFVVGTNEVHEMDHKIQMLIEAMSIVLNEVKSSFSLLGDSTMLATSTTKHIDSKIDDLFTVVGAFTQKQSTLLGRITQLSQSQELSFRKVNQRLNSLGDGINQLMARQGQLWSKYGHDTVNSFGFTQTKLQELGKSVEGIVNEQRKLVYFLSKGNAIRSTGVLKELSKLDGGMNQLSKFVQRVLEHQNKLLSYTLKGNDSIKKQDKSLRIFGEQLDNLYRMVDQVAVTQKHLITREEIIDLFKKQNGDIKGLSLELAEIGNRVVLLLNRQKDALRSGQTKSKELNELGQMLSQVDGGVRKLLVQQNILLQNGPKLHKDVTQVGALRGQLMNLRKVVSQISERQDHLLQQQQAGTKYILDDVGQVKNNLSKLSQAVEKITQLQLNLIQRGGLTPEQAHDLQYIKSELGNLDGKVAVLVEQQHVLVNKLSAGPSGNKGIVRIVRTLDELRKAISQLTKQQTYVLSQKPDIAASQNILNGVSQLNKKLLSLGKDVDQLFALQKTLLTQSAKDSSTIVKITEKLDSKVGQLDAYVKELLLEQKAVLLDTSKLIKQNLIQNDKLSAEVKAVDKKLENLVRIQFNLLKRINGERNPKETVAILQKLSELTSLTNQLMEQQKKLAYASSTGKVSQTTLQQLGTLNEKYNQLAKIIDQISSKQNTLVDVSNDSNATGHKLEEQINEVNHRLLGLSDFIKKTFNEQTQILHTREIASLLGDQNQRLAGLGVKLGELGNQFDKMINGQEVIVKKLGQVAIDDTKRDRAIAVELGTLREVLRKLVDSQKHLLGPEVVHKVGEGVIKSIEGLNDRMIQLGKMIGSIREEQSVIVRTLGEGTSYKQMENRFDQLHKQFSQMAKWIRQIASEQGKLLQRDELLDILKVQTNGIHTIQSNLTKFRNDVGRIVDLQKTLLHDTQAASQNDAARDAELLDKMNELRKLTEGLINAQQVILHSDLYKTISKDVLSQVHQINARLEKLEPTTFDLLKQQKQLLELNSVEKHKSSQILTGVKGVSTGVTLLLNEIKQIHGEQKRIISQNTEIKSVLEKQLGYINRINGQLAKFSTQTLNFLSQQAKFLERLIASQENDKSGIKETLERVKQLQNAVTSVVHWQHSLNIPEILGSLPKTLSNHIRDISAKIIRLTDNVASLSQQQSIIAKKEDGEFGSIRQGLNELNGRMDKFGDAIGKISSAQNKLIHDDEILKLLNNQTLQIHGLGVNLNSIRAEISKLISDQQQFFVQGSKFFQGDKANLDRMNATIAYVRKVMDQLFKQQQLFSNSQLLNQFPKHIVHDVETLNGEMHKLQEFVKELRKLQTATLENQIKSTKTTQVLVQDVEVLSGRFNGLSDYVKKILELQQTILRNEKIGPILEKFYGNFQQIEGRLAQLDKLVRHILENQQSLINTDQFKTFARRNSLDDKKMVETLSNLHNTIRVLIEQQKDLIKPEMLNSVTGNLHHSIQSVGEEIAGLSEKINQIQAEQSQVIKEQHNLNLNFNEAVKGLNKQLIDLNQRASRLFVQQKDILQNEQVLTVMAEKLNDLAPIKSNLAMVNEKLNSLLSQQKDIALIAQRSGGEGPKDNKQILDRFTSFSQMVRHMITKQTTLLSEQIIEKAPKRLLGQIVALNRQFDLLNLGLGKLFEVQKKILNPGYSDVSSNRILSGLDLLSQHYSTISKTAKNIEKTQNNLMSREELLAILQKQSGAIQNVHTKVGQLDEKVGVLIGQQRALLESISQKFKPTSDSHETFGAVLTHLEGLEKGIKYISQEQRKLSQLNTDQRNKMDDKILNSTHSLDQRVARLAQVVGRLFENQRALIIAEKDTKTPKGIFAAVEKLNANLVHLDGAVQFLVKDVQKVDARISALLQLPQDMENVKSRLAHLTGATKRLVDQHTQLFGFTKEGIDTLTKQQRVMASNVNSRLSEITKLVDQLIQQQKQIMSAEPKNSPKHSKAVATLISKIFKIEQVIEFLLNEQRKMYQADRNEQKEQFNNLDRKLNLFGEALKQFVNQQHSVMKILGVVERQTAVVNDMSNKLGNLNSIVSTLVSQQQQLLVYTKEHAQTENPQIDGRLTELRETVSKILQQHKILLERGLQELSSGRDRKHREITAQFDNRLSQVASLVQQLVHEQETVLSQTKHQNQDNPRIVSAVSRISGHINELAKLMTSLNNEQSTLIERGFTHLSQQNNQEFRHVDERLDQIGSALKRLAGDETSSLINRFENASRQQSQENKAMKSQLYQITRVLERIVSKTDLISPDNTGDITDVRRRLDYLNQVLTRLTEIHNDRKHLALTEDQYQKVSYLMNMIPALNESIKRFDLSGSIHSPESLKQLSIIRESIEECNRAIIGLQKVLNLSGPAVASFVSPEISTPDAAVRAANSRSDDPQPPVLISRVELANPGLAPYRILSNNDDSNGDKSTTNNVSDGEVVEEDPAKSLYDNHYFNNGYWYPRNEVFNEVIGGGERLL